MRIERESWNESEYQKSFNNTLGAQSVGIKTSDRQPGFAVEVAWNEPSKIWKPFIAVLIWRWRVEIGWLLDAE